MPTLAQAARLNPADPEAAQALREAYSHIGDHAQEKLWGDRAVALTRSAAERLQLDSWTWNHPQDQQAHLRYAAALAQIGDVNGCVRQHALAARTVPDNPRALIAAARDLDRAGFSAQALPLARQVTAASTQNPEAYEVLGDVLIDLGRLHEAAIDYERIRDWRPEKRALYKRKLAEAAKRLATSNAPAECLLRQAEHEADAKNAEALLQQALAIEPDNTRCLRALLRLQFANREADAAAPTAARLMNLSPEDGTAHTLLVVGFLRQLGDRPLSAEDDRALTAHLKAAANDFSVAPIFFYARGLLALKHGQTQEAVGYLETAARLDPKAADVYEKLAAAKIAEGDAEGAKQAMAQFNRRPH